MENRVQTERDGEEESHLIEEQRHLWEQRVHEI